MVLRQLLEEVENPNHRFDRAKSWCSFEGFEVPGEWNGMLPNWHRLFSRSSDDPVYRNRRAA